MAKTKPTIFVYSACGGGDGPAFALAEDGTVLGEHWCSSDVYVARDLGADGSRPDRHETYLQHYPDGYEVEFVPANAVNNHAGLRAALARNHAQADETAN